MAQREENLDPGSDEKQRMLQKVLKENSDDRQLQLQLENSETMHKLLTILSENEDILQKVSKEEREEREFNQGLLPGIRQHLFQKTLTKTDVKKHLQIPLEAYGEMKKADPSLTFHEIPKKVAKSSTASTPCERLKAPIQILDEELRWWKMKLVLVRHANGQHHYELNLKDFVKLHKPREGDQIHFYKLTNLENKFGTAIEKAGQ